LARLVVKKPRRIRGRALIIKCPGLDWPLTAGPGLAVKWIKLGAAPQPWGFLLIVFAQASLARRSVKSPAAFAAGL